MLTVLGGQPGGRRMCDGLARRQFLRIGSLAGLGGVAGFSMPELLRAEAAAGSRQKSVIMIFLPGGPPHQDMVDLKPDAP